ncbi:MAG: 4Fe-4S dicluster domain-containing protein [Methylobacteriaceae bacterium]|nr:4Fe-4S dicluster domain-containing protein [Methylobacteriaceae bacterium]
MAKPNPHRPFAPDPAMVALRPHVTGEEINGVGENEPRRPDVVFWATNPDDIPFGGVQRWFFTKETPGTELAAERARRRVVLEAPLPEVAARQVERSPDEWTAALNAFVAGGDCERAGVTPMRAEWLFAGQTTAFRNVIILGVQHDYDELKSAPGLAAGVDVMRQYTRAATVAKKVAGWLREQGWDAEPVTGPMATKLVLIPPAIEAGFGELGKHGSLINPEFGAAFRLGAVLTDAPFAPSGKRTFGVDDFCASCRVCEEACPPEAIAPVKKMVRGEERWSVNFDKCIPFFAETSGCAICIAVCPWSRPGVGLNLAGKLARRRQRGGEAG